MVSEAFKIKKAPYEKDISKLNLKPIPLVSKLIRIFMEQMADRFKKVANGERVTKDFPKYGGYKYEYNELRKNFSDALKEIIT